MIKITEEDLLKELGFFESGLGDILKKSHTGIRGIAKMLYISAILTYLREKRGYRFDCLMTALLQTMLDNIRKSLSSEKRGFSTPLTQDFEEIRKEVLSKKEDYPKLVKQYLNGKIGMYGGYIKEKITKEEIQELKKFFFSHEYIMLIHVNK